MAKPAIPFDDLPPDIQNRLIKSGAVPAPTRKMPREAAVIQPTPVPGASTRATVSRTIDINSVKLSELPSDIRDWLIWVIRFDDLKADARQKVIKLIPFDQLPPDLAESLELALKIRKNRPLFRRYDVRIGHLPWPVIVRIFTALRVSDLPAELWRKVVKTLGIRSIHGRPKTKKR